MDKNTRLARRLVWFASMIDVFLLITFACSASNGGAGWTIALFIPLNIAVGWYAFSQRLWFEYAKERTWKMVCSGLGFTGSKSEFRFSPDFLGAGIRARRVERPTYPTLREVCGEHGNWTGIVRPFAGQTIEDYTKQSAAFALAFHVPFVTLGLLAEGRRYVSNQTAIKGIRSDAGYIGGIASKEITYGFNGWHPHTHDLEFYERPLSLDHFAGLSGGYYSYLNRYYVRHGFSGLSRQHGVKVEDVQLDNGALARYVAKLQEGSAVQLYTAQELTRSDLKRGRIGSRMPFDIITSFFQTGDMDELGLWHEYERGTFGKSVIRFTKGLRARLLADEPEKTDEELAAMEIGGTDVLRFNGWFYRKIARVPGLEGKILTALDGGGFAALVELLTVYHMDELGGYEQIEA